MTKPKDITGEILVVGLIAAVVASLGAFAALDRRQIHEVFTAITLVLTIIALVRTRKAAS